jgi:molybdopterin-guanine dinucleotide biosynthesis protein A
MLNSDVAADLVAMLDDFDAVIPEVGGMLQPLHAVYRKHCANAIAALEASGEKRLTRSADAINARKVGEQELRALDPELSSFFNVNTPDDYQRALKLAGIGK